MLWHELSEKGSRLGIPFWFLGWASSGRWTAQDASTLARGAVDQKQPSCSRDPQL